MITSIHKPSTGLLATTIAALFVQIGVAAAATPPSDFQQQVRRVLAGTGVSRPAGVDSERSDRFGRDREAQASVQRLLLGETATPPVTLHAVTRHGQTAGLQLARAAGANDPQASVQQVLLGRRSALRGSL